MQHAYAMRASQPHTNYRASNECTAPIHSDTASLSALTSQPLTQRACSNQRANVIPVRDRCLGTHPVSASHPAGAAQLSSDHLV